ncbi:MAG: poly-gamma-glutamate system protein [Candidatus Eisenbacteria bacterium]
MALRLETQRKILVLVLGVAAIGCAWILEATKTFRAVPGHDQKRAAVELSQRAYDTLRDYYRNDLGRTIDLRNDKAGTGLIGPRGTAIQNAGGNLAAKRTSINPNFAALIVDYFQQIGLERGDLVAVGLTGSYPGTNVNVYAAINVMGLEPIVITAVGASGWGATDPDFTWLDMERVLAQRGVIDIHSIAASAGGGDDMGGSKSAEEKDQIQAAIERNGVPVIQSRSLDESIDKRMELIYGEAQGRPIKAYVNVGGSSASLGFSLADVHIASGLHRDLASWPINWPREGPMIRIAKRGAPVINLGALQGLAREYGLTVAPQAMPLIGEGTLLGRAGYSLAITAIVLAIYLFLVLFMTLPSWRRLVVRQENCPPGAAPPAHV